MKHFQKLLVAGLGLLLAGRVMAQTFTNLYSFTATPDFPLQSNPRTNSDGAVPSGCLVLSGNTLYGTSRLGGSSGSGTVFAINICGTGFTNLHIFTETSGSPYNSDGAYPWAGLILSSNTLYGTTYGGGSSAHGTIFAVNTDGTGFTNLHIFSSYYFNGTNDDGASPAAGLIISSNTLYGATVYGGSFGGGTIFAVSSDGTSFTNLYNFGGNDGANPSADLILSGNTLYGTTRNGGGSGYGTVFAINTDGTGFTNLHSFTDFAANPTAGLILSGNTLYGTTGNGGDSGYGAVFAVNTDGAGFTNLHSFVASDGVNPNAGLILSGNILYGTAYAGGGDGSFNGAIFAINTDGTGFTKLHKFAGNPNDGANPLAGLILSGNTLYGTTSDGGSFGNGTVFSLTIQPQLAIKLSGYNVVLTWPTNFVGFILQSTPTITGTFTNILGAMSPYTNPIIGAQQFFRLSHP